jgi:hypothetical protein
MAAISKIQRIAGTDDGLPKRWTLTISDVRYSLAELEATKAQITTTQPWANDSQPYLASWYVDASANTVHVRVTQITPTLTQDAATFEGKVTLAIEPRATPATRANDYPPPWWGGSVIGGCTGGFSAIKRSTGHKGLLTAGHCFTGTLQPAYNGSNFLGYVTWRLYGGGNYDAAFIDTQASSGISNPYVYTGGLNDATHSASVTYFLNALPGDQVCFDGSVTFQNCNADVVGSNDCIVYNDGAYVCGIDTADSTNGSWVVRKGDSGGPVYWYTGGTNVTAVGLISGYQGSGNGGTRGYFTDFYTDLNSTFRMNCVTASSCT